jgi:hypothetical protein
MVAPMMHAVKGGCYCGNILLELELSREPGQYHPRACDCGFCRKHGAAYLSDPQGSLRIRIDDASQSGAYRQGNELAEMLLCTRCGVLVGALYRSGGHVYATVNAKAIEAPAEFGTEQPASPRLLSADEKVDRWKTLWFSDVRFG